MTGAYTVRYMYIGTFVKPTYARLIKSRYGDLFNYKLRKGIGFVLEIKASMN